MRQAFSGLSWVRSKALPQISSFIYQHGGIERYKKGAVVIHAGKSYDKLSIITKGLLSKAIHNTSVNKDTAFSLLIPQRLLGTSYFMSRQKSNLIVRALRDTEIISVASDVVEEFMFKDPCFLKALHQQFSIDWESDLEGLASLSFFTPEEKLKILFKALLLSYEVNLKEEWAKLPVKLSNMEMAHVIYTTRLTVIRILNAWKSSDVYRQNGAERHISTSFLNDVYDWQAKS